MLSQRDAPKKAKKHRSISAAALFWLLALLRVVPLQPRAHRLPNQLPEAEELLKEATLQHGVTREELHDVRSQGDGEEKWRDDRN